MKKTALSLLLAAAALFTACGTAPLATPTPDPAAAAEPTPEPQNGEFYALDRGSSTFNSGDAYYEFTQKLGYCLLLKTDYATAAQTVCCEIPGCTHVNCTPFVRQYDILSNKWGDLLCQEENRTNDIRRNSRKWL